MAAGLGFKTFATGDVLTAGDTNGYLMQGVWVFADAAARSAAVTSPQEGNISFLKDTNSTEYYSGSAWVAIGGAAGGKLLQLVQAVSTTATTIASTTMTDTGLSLSITPTSATSKILVMVNQNAFLTRSSNANLSDFRILRGATAIYTMTGAIQSRHETTSAPFASNTGLYVTGTYLDSPATTSSTTYKTQAKVDTTLDSQQVVCQASSGPSSITLMEIGA